MLGKIKGNTVRNISLRKLKKYSFSPEIEDTEVRKKAESVLKDKGRVYVIINKNKEIIGGYIFTLNKNGEHESEKCTFLEQTEEFFTNGAEDIRNEFDEALEKELTELTALVSIRYVVFKGEKIIYSDEFEKYFGDEEGSKSVIWMIILFLVFYKLFSSIALGLLFAYILSPYNKSEKKAEESRE